MRKVVVTGLGFASSIGSRKADVLDHLWKLQHGFAPFPAREGELRTPHWYGAVKDYRVRGWDPEDWGYPSRFRIAQTLLKSMSPHVLYAYCTALDAFEDAGIPLSEVSDRRTGLYSASGGSAGLQHELMVRMNKRGVHRCPPFSVVATAVGAINFNLGAAFSIQGAVCGFASACASSAHALGMAYDAIAFGRQDRMVVIGAEDCTRESILPFAAMRALSNAEAPELASCPFDARRSGFVGSGGAATLILEAADVATSRGAPVYAEIAGWGEAADGHSQAMPHPEGRGLSEAMRRALEMANASPDRVDYVNAHATSTVVGDVAELCALKRLFGGSAGRRQPVISSTKALTGHPLSMSGALEGAICCLAVKEGFIPGSAHIGELAPEAEGLSLQRMTENRPIDLLLSNSSGFGGSNVSLVFKRWDN